MGTPEQNRASNKKILTVFGIVIGGMLVFGYGYKILIKDPAEAEHKAELARMHTDDSIAASKQYMERQAAQEAHEERMRTDRKYRDSVTRSEAAKEKARIDEERTVEPQKHITVSHSWRAGGFGTVALSNVTIDNKSLKDCSNPTVIFLLKSSNGTLLDSRTVEIPETFRAGRKTKSSELNLGFISKQVEGISVEFVSATWR